MAILTFFVSDTAISPIPIEVKFEYQAILGDQNVLEL